MNNREPADRLYDELANLAEDMLPSAEEIERRLSEADFSAKNSIQKSLRQHLEQRIRDDLSNAQLEQRGVPLPSIHANTWIKVGLIGLVLLAQALIHPSPQPAISRTSQPVASFDALIAASSPPAVVTSTTDAAYLPIPVPTPGVEAALTSAVFRVEPSRKRDTISAASLVTGGETPKPTPLAILATLP